MLCFFLHLVTTLAQSTCHTNFMKLRPTATIIQRQHNQKEKKEEEITNHAAEHCRWCSIYNNRKHSHFSDSILFLEFYFQNEHATHFLLFIFLALPMSLLLLSLLMLLLLLVCWWRCRRLLAVIIILCVYYLLHVIPLNCKLISYINWFDARWEFLVSSPPSSLPGQRATYTF